MGIFIIGKIDGHKKNNIKNFRDTAMEVFFTFFAIFMCINSVLDGNDIE